MCFAFGYYRETLVSSLLVQWEIKSSIYWQGMGRGSFCRVLSTRIGLFKKIGDFGTPHIIYWLKLRDISKFPSLPDLALNRCHLHEMQYKIFVFK